MAKYPFPKSCAHCRKEFIIKGASYRHCVYCSHACAALAKRIHPREANCLRCDKLLSGHQKQYCSMSCAAIVNNHVSPKRKKKVKEKKIRVEKVKIIKPNDEPKVVKCTCAHCGLGFESSKYRKYCAEHIGLYSHAGKARYWFSINVFKYPELFDLDTLKRVGFRSHENPYCYTRDHKVSVNEAIKNNYDPYYIKHVMNCELMLWDENNRKNTRSSISYEELKKLVDDYDATHT